ncbi:MAG: UbiA prenyltransferase family protein [Cryomorphaceae bacterium]|nr:UbiA prenyltransferase family protein [Cryomorphaceae bacterium]
MLNFKTKKRMTENPITDTIKHLRFPFSLFLLPVFLFALTIAENQNPQNVFLLFVILHFLIYPSSNGFNGLQDRDTESIGGLKNPPPPPKLLRPTTIVMDLLGLALSLLISLEVFLLITLYMLASRAYSHRGIRLKKYPVIGFLVVALFQGGAIFITTYITAYDASLIGLQYQPGAIMGAITATILIAAGYPITQIYQHKQDEADGVRTLSMRLGIRGTILWSMGLFALFSGLLTWMYYPNLYTIGLYFLLGAPTFLYFANWQRRIWKNPSSADFSSTMKMNYISTISMNTFFGLVLVLQHFYA